MRKSCTIAATILKKLGEMVDFGVTTSFLNEEARKLMQSYGATSASFGYKNGKLRYPGYICISINDEVVHGLPSDNRVLKKGDIVSLDVAVIKDGYVGDNAATFGVGVLSQEVQNLVDHTRIARDLAVQAAKPNGRVNDIGSAVQNYIDPLGYGIVRDFTGHGVGRKMHEEPQILNYGKAGTGPILISGMTLAIEPMINLGTYNVHFLSDGWTAVTADGKPSAHFEHTVLITDNGPEILTLPE